MPAPTYSYISFAQAKQALADRLYDSSQTFWSPAELGLYLSEALRVWNALTAFWRGDFIFESQAGVRWYDLTSLAQMPNTLRPYTLTDNDVYKLIEYHLLEPASGSTWTGSLQFSANDLIGAVQRRRDEILSVCGCTQTLRTVPAVGGRIALPDTVIDVRRMAYQYTLPSSSTYTTLIAENFVGPNVNPLAGPWTPLGTDGINLAANQIVSNAVEATVASDVNDTLSASFQNTFQWPADQFAEITVNIANPSNEPAAGVLLRASPGNGYFLSLEQDSIVGQILWQMNKYVAGIPRVLNGAPIVGTFATGDTIRGEIAGTTLTLYHNGTLLGTYVDTSPITTGAPGIALQPFTSVADISITSWLAGSIAAAASTTTQSPVVWPADTWAEQSFETSYLQSPPGTPFTYLLSTQPPISFDVDVPPGYAGQYELLTVEAGPLLVAGQPQTLSIPDDWVHVIKWGALADLLSRDSNARDIPRAQYCEQRYRMGLKLLADAPALLALRVNNLPLQIDSVRSADEYSPSWESQALAQPNTAYHAGLNLIALSPAPDIGGSLYGVGYGNGTYNSGLYGLGSYSYQLPYALTATVVRNAPVPVLDGDLVQVAREDLDAIIDYAQHIATFKSGGAEFASTMQLFDRFLKQASVYNRKLMEFAEFSSTLRGISQRENQTNPRMEPETV